MPCHFICGPTSKPIYAFPLHLHIAIVQLICFFEDTSTCNLFLPMEKPASVVGYSVADLAGYLDTKRSITSWCEYLGPTLLSWKCRKQPCVSKSSTKLEY